MTYTTTRTYPPTDEIVLRDGVDQNGVGWSAWDHTGTEYVRTCDICGARIQHGWMFGYLYGPMVYVCDGHVSELESE